MLFFWVVVLKLDPNTITSHSYIVSQHLFSKPWVSIGILHLPSSHQTWLAGKCSTSHLVRWWEPNIKSSIHFGDFPDTKSSSSKFIKLALAVISYPKFYPIIVYHIKKKTLHNLPFASYDGLILGMFHDIKKKVAHLVAPGRLEHPARAEPPQPILLDVDRFFFCFWNMAFWNMVLDDVVMSFTCVFLKHGFTFVYILICMAIRCYKIL